MIRMGILLLLLLLAFHRVSSMAMSSTLTSAKHNLPLPLLFMDFNFTTFEQMHQVRAIQANDSVHLLSAKAV